MERILAEFYRFLRETKQMKENTISSYRRDIHAFVTFGKASGRTNIQEICGGFEDYIASFHAQGRSPATISRNIASLRCLFRYLVGRGLLAQDPSFGKKYEKKEGSAQGYEDLLTTDEIDRLISLSKTEDVKGYRDCAILETLYATGLKVSDFLNIHLEDLHLKEGYLTVTSEHHIRYVPLYKGALQAIRNYLNHSRKYLETYPKNNVLFLNHKGQPLSRQGLWKLLKAYGAAAGIQKELTPHLFRKSMAMHLVENGADLAVVQEILGHKNIVLTKNYVKNFKPRIVSDYEKYHPKSRL